VNLSDLLTEDERAEVLHDLQMLRETEAALLEVEPVSEAAAARRAETLARVRSELDRVARLLGPSRAGASQSNERT
jgi:hypothetical protein